MAPYTITLVQISAISFFRMLSKMSIDTATSEAQSNMSKHAVNQDTVGRYAENRYSTCAADLRDCGFSVIGLVGVSSMPGRMS